MWWRRRQRPYTCRIYDDVSHYGSAYMSNILGACGSASPNAKFKRVCVCVCCAVVAVAADVVDVIRTGVAHVRSRGSTTT